MLLRSHSPCGTRGLSDAFESPTLVARALSCRDLLFSFGSCQMRIAPEHCIDLSLSAPCSAGRKELQSGLRCTGFRAHSRLPCFLHVKAVKTWANAPWL
eukprot:6188803-Pleurochrysis_carterae.AAC.5